MALPDLQQPRPASPADVVPVPTAPAPPATPLDDSGFQRLLAQSPTLRSDLDTFQRAGGNVRWGTAGGGTFIANNNEIVIDRNSLGNGPQLAQSMAHELGHYKFSEPQDLGTRETYVRGLLRDEAAATLNNARVRQEISAAGGPDIGFPGEHAARYRDISARRLGGDITEEEALTQLGAVFKTERTSTTGQTYEDYYGASYPGPDRSRTVGPRPDDHAAGPRSAGTDAPRTEGAGPAVVAVADAAGSTPAERLRAAVEAMRLPGVDRPDQAERIANALALDVLQNGGRIEDIKSLTAANANVFGIKGEGQTFHARIDEALRQDVDFQRDALQRQLQPPQQAEDPARNRVVPAPTF